MSVFVTDSMFGDEPHRRSTRMPRFRRAQSRASEAGSTLGLGIADVANPTTVADAHRSICEAAAEIANQDPALAQLVAYPVNVWREASHGKGGGLSISYDEALMHGRDDEWKAEMAAIGRRAIRQALAQNANVLVGLILGEARHGRNYFHGF